MMFCLVFNRFMMALGARPRERAAARAGRAEKRTYCQTSRADPGPEYRSFWEKMVNSEKLYLLFIFFLVSVVGFIILLCTVF